MHITYLIVTVQVLLYHNCAKIKNMFRLLFENPYDYLEELRSCDVSSFLFADTSLEHKLIKNPVQYMNERGFAEFDYLRLDKSQEFVYNDSERYSVYSFERKKPEFDTCLNNKDWFFIKDLPPLNTIEAKRRIRWLIEEIGEKRLFILNCGSIKTMITEKIGGMSADPRLIAVYNDLILPNGKRIKPEELRQKANYKYQRLVEVKPDNRSTLITFNIKSFLIAAQERENIMTGGEFSFPKREYNISEETMAERTEKVLETKSENRENGIEPQRDKIAKIACDQCSKKDSCTAYIPDGVCVKDKDTAALVKHFETRDIDQIKSGIIAMLSAEYNRYQRFYSKEIEEGTMNPWLTSLASSINKTALDFLKLHDPKAASLIVNSGGDVNIALTASKLFEQGIRSNDIIDGTVEET